MSIVIVNDGARKLLDLKKQFLTGKTVNLYKNDYVPVNTSVTANFTPANFAGYAAKAQNYPNAAVDNGDGTATLTGDLVTFTPTANTTPNQIYGYYVTDPADGNKTIYAERFAGAPFTVGADLLQFAFYPTFSEATM